MKNTVVINGNLHGHKKDSVDGEERLLLRLALRRYRYSYLN
jgi:hypothetical protein